MARERVWTPVYSRFWVHGYIDGGERELAETCETLAEAKRTARRLAGPRGYDRTEVYDSMAHRNRPRVRAVFYGSGVSA